LRERLSIEPPAYAKSSGNAFDRPLSYSQPQPYPQR
jgi:hypothetical protein